MEAVIRESKYQHQKRQGIMVYVTQLKYTRQLRKLGYIHYVSRQFKYAVLYVNEENVEATLAKLDKLRYVKKVCLSERSSLVLQYDENKKKPEFQNFRVSLEGEFSCE